MTEIARFVQGVQGLCRVLCMVFSLLCRVVQGVFHFPMHAGACASTSNHNTFHKFKPLHTLHTLHMPFKSMTYEKIDTAQRAAHPAHGQRTIRCTPENAPQMQKVVKNWPELHSLVKDLQAADLFPGLRGLQITLSGPHEYLDKGLGALLPATPAKPD